MRSRSLAPRLRQLLRDFPIVIVAGPRQVGKTTLARAQPGRTYVTLDDLTALDAARGDPVGFLRDLPRPVTIDEVQRAPELVLAVKHAVDLERSAGDFLLTGSTRLGFGSDTTDSLAGRAAVLRLRPMTWAEQAGRASWNAVDVLFGERTASGLARRFARSTPLQGLRVLAGGLPVPMLTLKGGARTRWFEHYRSTYLERDVPALVRADETTALSRFVTLAATRTAQTTNFADLAREVGVSADTGRRWFGVLEATYLVDLVTPWFRNVGKRLVKAPKLHFGDAGLAAHLLGAHTFREAQSLHVAGPLLETLVAQHLLSFASATSRVTGVHHYRTHAGAEVDFVLVRGSRLLPIEVKAAATVKPSELRGLRSFMDDHAGDAPLGVLLYGGETAVPMGGGIVALPLEAVLGGNAGGSSPD
jgi:predicted AAA+ superfamily ATPase